MYEEISRTSKKDEDITNDILSKMQYLKATVKESLRLHSIGSMNARQIKQDLLLDDYLVPKDVIIIIFISNLVFIFFNCCILKSVGI